MDLRRRLRARPLRLLGVSVAVVALTLSNTMPASATASSCDPERLVAWQLATADYGSEHPEPVTTPIPSGCEGVEQWRLLASAYFGWKEVDRVLCLMERESAGDPGAHNGGSGASGLMQVMPFWAGRYGYHRSDLFDPAVNLWIAARIREEQGWRAWSPYLRGDCR